MSIIYRIIIAAAIALIWVVQLQAERLNELSLSRPTPGTLLIICGGSMVYIIDVDTALDSDDWHSSIVWSWDARTLSTTIGLSESRLDHIDDCKLVDNGRKILVTSSFGWCAMVDYDTRKPVFYSNTTPNAHSADLLPGNLIAVACSDGTTDSHNMVHLYDADRPNEKIAQYSFPSCHATVWNATTERLYAAGARKIGSYRLSGRTLELVDETVTAKSDVHDVMAINPGKMSVAGKEGFIYDIAQKSFRNIPFLIGRTSLKSLNINSDSGEMWYTDASDTANISQWFSHDLWWASGRMADGPALSIKIPDVNVYKVRVARWGQSYAEK